MFSSRRKNRLFLETLGAGALAAVTAGAIFHQFSLDQRSSSYAISAPAGVPLHALRPPPSPLQVLSAKYAATRAIGQAIDTARAAVPEVPWGRWGLADVQIKGSAIRFDDARGHYVAALDDGRIAVLTWDPRVQRRLQDVVRRSGEPGEAVVAMEPATGRVLAMVSDGSSDETGANLARRAYAWSASNFKVLTAAALFERGKATPTTEVCFHGGGDGFSLDMLRDNPALDTLCISVTRAMAISANVVFGKLADRHLNADALQETAERFGYNHRIPFEMEVETSGFEAPTERLEFAMAAAGFRHSKMSPLHGAMIQAAIANGGVMMVPTMVARIENADGTLAWEHHPVEWMQSASRENAELLRQTESNTCVNGTARADFSARPGWPATITSWGKTGTLLNRQLDGSLTTAPLMYQWFTGFSQRGEREVAVAALVVQNPSWEIRGTYLASEAVLAALPASP